MTVILLFLHINMNIEYDHFTFVEYACNKHDYMELKGKNQH
jgi:hypothetical protein